MMKKCSKISKALSIAALYSILVMPVQHVAAQMDQAVTQGEFAKYLVRALGLEHNLPVGANVLEYIDILEQLNMEPPGGYDPTAPLTKKDMAFIMVRVSGLENKAINKMTSKSLVKKEQATVQELQGDVQFKRGPRSEYAPAEVNDTFFLEDSIKTGKNSWVVLKVGRFGAARIEENTEITIEQLASNGDKTKESVRIYLHQGSMIVNVKSQGNKVNFETRSKTTVAGVMGSSYQHSASKKEEIIRCFEGPISSYLTGSEGNPITDPKSLESRQQLFVDPNDPMNPKYSSFGPDEFKKPAEFANNLAKYLPQAPQGQPAEQTPGESAGSAQTTETDDLSSFEARQQLAQGSDLAFNAAVEALSESGIVIESEGGAATAASAPITQVQLTSFINDLLLSDTFDFFNVDTTPIGQ